MAWQDHQPSPRTQERRGHGLSRKEKACTQAMPSPKTHVSFMPKELNSYQNVQQNQTNMEAMANA